jgi:hypothetical protein
MSRKPPTYYIERYFLYVLSILFGILLACYTDPKTVLCKSGIFDKAIDVGGILFGFLLTVLTLLIQTNSAVIKQLKNGGRFKDLISYNKEAVFCSVLLFSYSFLLLIYAEYIVVYTSFFVDKIAYGLFASIVLITVLKTYKFTKIFYKIIS